LAEMGNQGIPFWQLALNYSRRWHNEFLAEPLQASEFAEFQTASAASLRQQELLEDDTSESFAEYLQRFYSQYR
ncbi:MAG: glutamate--cysteine ligase, partial [Luminiphilus sp.]